MDLRREIRLSDLGKPFKRSKRRLSARKAAPRRREWTPQPHLVGLKVGASQIAAAEVQNNGAPKLLRVARAPLAAGVVVGGEVREPAALASTLREFFERHELPVKAVRLGISNNRISVRALELRGIADQTQLDNAIRFRAQELLPIPLEEAVLDYHTLSETPEADGTSSWRVLLVVAHRDPIDRYVTACRAAGLQLAGIDLEAFGLLRAVATPLGEGADADRVELIAVSLGHDRSTVAVSDGRVCEFTRVLSWGGANLTAAVSRALALEPDAAEAVKRSLSLQTASAPGLTEEQAATVVAAVRKELESFARELISSLHFYQSQPGSHSIGETIVTGGTAQLPGLADELERLIGVPVRVADPLARVGDSRIPLEGQDLGSLTVAIGLGIED